MNSNLSTKLLAIALFLIIILTVMQCKHCGTTATTKSDTVTVVKTTTKIDTIHSVKVVKVPTFITLHDTTVKVLTDKERDSLLNDYFDAHVYHISIADTTYLLTVTDTVRRNRLTTSPYDIKVFNKTITHTITNTVTINKRKLYAGLSLGAQYKPAGNLEVSPMLIYTDKSGRAFMASKDLFSNNIQVGVGFLIFGR